VETRRPDGFWMFAAVVAFVPIVAVVTLGPDQAAPVASCDVLASLALPNGTITGAEAIEAGAFVPPMRPGRPMSAGQRRQFEALPAFCRVTATLTPSSDSEIKVEVWMPATGWNGKMHAVGNGAFTGSHRYGSARSLASGLERGYATASTDTGHEGGSASFALGHPEKVIDFGWRAVHEMTVTAKQVIAAFYGSVLVRLLRRWASGDDGGAAIPGRL